MMVSSCINKDEPELLIIFSKALSYDEETGIFFWKSKPGLTQEERRWNSRYAGKEAGALCRGYLVVKLKINGVKRHMYLHRLSFYVATNTPPSDEIDHVNGIKTDNRICNLRVVTRGENCRNKKLSTLSKSGICGVHWHARMKKWQASYSVDGHRYHVGSFDTIEEASSTVEAKRKCANAFTERHGSSSV